METTFVEELQSLLNRHSMENASGTPDFILAYYLSACLNAWNAGVKEREDWYGRTPYSPATPTQPESVDAVDPVDGESTS